jgi:hypothetical protein
MSTKSPKPRRWSGQHLAVLTATRQRLSRDPRSRRYRAEGTTVRVPLPLRHGVKTAEP